MKKTLILLWWMGGLAACAHAPRIDAVKADAPAAVSERRALLIGRWYAELPTKDGATRKSLMERRRDGTYTVRFQLLKGGVKTLDQVEAGIWGVSGNVYFTATREMLADGDFRAVETTDATYYDAYEIQKLDGENFVYRSLDMGDRFVTRRVGPGFQLP